MNPCKHGHVDGAMHIPCKDCRIEELEARAAELEKYRRFYEGMADCFDDTWQCERCGHAEPWWAECNADYGTREAKAEIDAAIRAAAEGKE